MSNLLFYIISVVVLVPLNTGMFLLMCKLYKEFSFISFLAFITGSLIPIFNASLFIIQLIVILAHLIIEPPESLKKIDALVVKLMEGKK